MCLSLSVCVCVCVCVSVCVFYTKHQPCVSDKYSKLGNISMSVCVIVCVCVRERESVCASKVLCVCGVSVFVYGCYSVCGVSVCLGM